VLLASQAPARLFGECLREEENRGSVDQRQRDPGGGARRRLCALGGPRGARQPESHRASQSRGPSSPALQHWTGYTRGSCAHSCPAPSAQRAHRLHWRRVQCSS
jgi:hypothetical protein